MDKSIYYETYPLGSIAVSKISATIAFISVIIELWDIGYQLILIYSVLYVLGFFLNVKLRANMCKYYGKTIHSRIGKIIDRIPPKVDAGRITADSKSLVALSLFSSILVLLPIVFLIVILLVPVVVVDYQVRALVFTVIYIIALVLPSYIFKKKILSGVCEF